MGTLKSELKALKLGARFGVDLAFDSQDLFFQEPAVTCIAPAVIQQEIMNQTHLKLHRVLQH